MYVIKQNNGKRIQRNQHGFVLVMALVLLAAMTLIGVSSMTGSSMELKAAANARQHQIAFNAVHSLLQYTLAADAVTAANTPVDYQISDITVTQNVTHTLANASALQATIVFAGCSSGVGSSLEAGKGVSYNFYNIDASGSNAAGTSTSLQGQGVRYPSASCGSL